MSDVPRFLNPALFDKLLTMMALPMFAPYSTSLALSSTCNLHVDTEHAERQLISALQSHMQHRFASVAGHYAPASSGSTPRPGFCAFPALRQPSLDRRPPTRTRIGSSEYTASFSGSVWTDGTTPEIVPDEPASEQGQGGSTPPFDSHTTDFAIERLQSATNARNIQWDNFSGSTSEDEPNFLSRLMCQPSTSKNAKHKQRTQVQMLLRKKPPQQGQAQNARPLTGRSTKLQKFTSQAAQRLPSAIRLRRTQSAPRNSVEKAAQVTEGLRPRRRSSNPSIRRPVTYHCIIPQICRIPATPATSNHPYASTNASVRDFGRSEMSPTPELFEETRRHQIELWRSKALFPPKNTPSQSIRSPASSIETRRNTLPAVYFDRVYSDDHASDKTDNPSPVGEGNCATGPDVNHCPRLQRVLSNMSHGDEDSSDSELERMKKRKSILIQDSSESGAIAGIFGLPSGSSSRR
ncbi:hypothetical protein J1614_004283 [Plenodomus biglobosus]|nr:hypothetical protein J1614_004283 [Plenodomus biglobosus]